MGSGQYPLSPSLALLPLVVVLASLLAVALISPAAVVLVPPFRFLVAFSPACLLGGLCFCGRSAPLAD